eukprot:TRINITY_DN13926_c0_g1_i6.p2 TRINITY_DN13926_c0_g1~~TRINITY_DN13926_c0_g1_i6.p2  ORF type:complete len:107 (+),score=9.32 TRINITY_DN13926_c0_g1_i6:24-323(+)
MIRRPPRSTQSRSSAASDVYKRQGNSTIYSKADIYAFYLVLKCLVKFIAQKSGPSKVAPNSGASCLVTPLFSSPLASWWDEGLLAAFLRRRLSIRPSVM